MTSQWPLLFGNLLMYLYEKQHSILHTQYFGTILENCRIRAYVDIIGITLKMTKNAQN